MLNLIDYSIIVIGLAIFGFLIRDNFYLYRKYCKPYELKNSTDNLFSNISLAIFIIACCLITINMFILPNPELLHIFEPTLTDFETLVEHGIITQSELFAYISTIIFYGKILIIFSYIYVIVIFITMVVGLIAVYIDLKGVKVFFNGPENSKEYKRIICESNDFVYLEKFENFREWEAIKKSDILKIESIETKSRFDRYIIKKFSDFINKHSAIGDPKKRLYLIFIFLSVYLISVFLIGFGVIFQILSIIIIIPMIILLVISRIFS